MSANNWRECPRCMKRAIEEKEAAVVAAKASYGKAPPEEYEAAMAEARKPVVHEETFREDYELGVLESGKFFVNYSGTCTRCGLSHEFSHKEQVPLEPFVRVGKGAR